MVVGGGAFGGSVTKRLGQLGAEIDHVDVTSGASLADGGVKNRIVHMDAIVFAEHESRVCLVGKGGQISAKELRELNETVALAHIAGNVQQTELAIAGIAFRPKRLASAGYMSVATDYLGPRPLIDLHTAGLKVGQLLAAARLRGLVATDAEQSVLEETTLASSLDALLTADRGR